MRKRTSPTFVYWHSNVLARNPLVIMVSILVYWLCVNYRVYHWINFESATANIFRGTAVTSFRMWFAGAFTFCSLECMCTRKFPLVLCILMLLSISAITRVVHCIFYANNLVRTSQHTSVPIYILWNPARAMRRHYNVQPTVLKLCALCGGGWAASRRPSFAHKQVVVDRLRVCVWVCVCLCGASRPNIFTTQLWTCVIAGAAEVVGPRRTGRDSGGLLR